MTEYIEIAIRWIFAGQMLFWGLNGYFDWIKIPPASETMTRFTEACIETKFIMSTVKLIEILGGILLLLNFTTALVLMAFAPILFVITGLQLLHNPKPGPVLATITLPYLLLVFFHHESLLRIIH